jgi:hypothetical protein
MLHVQFRSDTFTPQIDVTNDRNLSRLLRVAIFGSIWLDLPSSSSNSTPVYFDLVQGLKIRVSTLEFFGHRYASMLGLGLDHESAAFTSI